MSPPLPSPSASRAAPFGALLCLLVATLAHAASVRNGWTLDDVPVVRDNPALAGSVAPLFRRPSWPGEREQQPWRPLTLASLALETRVWGGAKSPSAAPGLHAVNVALHAVNAMLLLALLTRALPRRRLWAVGTALVFAAHPLAVHVVSSATGRADLLAVLFALLALGAWSAYAPGRAGTLPLAALCFFLALLAKEAAVGLPLVALLLDVGARGMGPLEALRRRWTGYAALTAVLVLWLLLWPGPGGPGVEVPPLGPGPRLLLGLEALGRQTLAALVPVGLSADRSAEAVAGSGVGAGWPCVGAALAFTLAAGLLLLVCWSWPERGAAGRRARGVLLVAGGVALAQALTLPLGAGLEDRAAYLLLPALAGLGGLALESLLTARGRAAAPGLVGSGVVVLALGTLCTLEAAAWKDDALLHERLLAREPGHGPAVLRLASRFADQAEEQRAIAMTLGVQDPRLAMHHRASQEARARALELADRASRLVGLRDGPEVHLLLGRLLLDDGRAAEAETELKAARAADPLLNPDRPVGEVPADARRLERARRIYAGLGRAHLALGRGGLAAEDYVEALRWERRAARTAGRAVDGDLMHTAAMALIADGRFPEGLELLTEIASSAPDPGLRRLAAREHEQQQRNQVERLRTLLLNAREAEDRHQQKAALETYLEALRVDPSSLDARERGAFYLKFFGRFPEAKHVVEDGLALLAHAQPGPDTDRARVRLTALAADLVRWERENAAEEERDLAPPKPPERK